MLICHMTILEGPKLVYPSRVISKLIDNPVKKFPLRYRIGFK